MTKKYHFLTGNKLKFEIASEIFQKYGIELVQNKTEIPEIQAETTGEVAKNSAKHGAYLLGVPVIVNDSGFFINSLGGFPGVFTKDINKKFSSQNLLDLMIRYVDRSVKSVGSTAFCIPGQEPILFESVLTGKLAFESGGDFGNCFDELLVIDGLEKVRGAYSLVEIKEKVFSKLTDYHEMAKYLKTLG